MTKKKEKNNLLLRFHIFIFINNSLTLPIHLFKIIKNKKISQSQVIRQLTDISISFPPTISLPATHVYLSLRIFFFFPHKSTTPHGLPSKDSEVLFFQFSLLSVLCFVFHSFVLQAVTPSVPLSLCKLDKILSFTVSPKSRGYLIPIQKAGFNTKHEHSVIFSFSQA